MFDFKKLGRNSLKKITLYYTALHSVMAACSQGPTLLVCDRAISRTWRRPEAARTGQDRSGRRHRPVHWEGKR